MNQSPNDDSGGGAETLRRLTTACFFLSPPATVLAFIIGGADVGLAVAVGLGLLWFFLFLVSAMCFMVVEPLRRMWQRRLERRAAQEDGFPPDDYDDDDDDDPMVTLLAGLFFVTFGLTFVGFRLGGENVGGLLFVLSMVLLSLFGLYYFFIHPFRLWLKDWRRAGDADERTDALVNGLFLVVACGLALVSTYLAFNNKADVRFVENLGALWTVSSMALLGLFGLYFCIVRPCCRLWRESRRARAERRRQEAERELAARILLAFARVDGRFTRTNLAVMLDFLKNEPGDDAARLGLLKTLLKRASADPRDLAQALRVFARDAPKQARLRLAELARRLASAQGRPLSAKARLVRDIAAALDIAPAAQP